MKKFKIAVVFVIAIVIMLTGCTAESGDNIIFGTFYNLKIKGASSNNDIKEISSLFVDIEKKVSTNIETSDIYKINSSPTNTPIKVNNHTIELFKKSKELYEDTEKAFNSAIFPLVQLWKFSPDTYTGIADSIPNETQISEVKEYCKMENFALNEQNSTITKLHKDAKLDFGGIAKGYAVDKAMDICSSNKDSIINIGGNISTFGKNKRIGITHPRNSTSLFGVINLKNNSIATSGDYERYYVYDDIRYNHIIAKNGYPTGIENNNIISATVVGESAMICDALTTSIMILGTQWAENNITQMNYSCLIITKENYQIIGEMDFENKQNSHQKI